MLKWEWIKSKCLPKKLLSHSFLANSVYQAVVTLGLKTSYDHFQWAKFGGSWTIGGESCVIVRCYTTSQPSSGLARRLGGVWSCSKTWLRCPRLYRTIIARRCATSIDVMRRRGWLCHICTCSHVHCLLMMLCIGRMTSYEIAQPSYDCNRVQMLTSASRQTITVKSYDLIRLSYDGRTMSY